jgi:hypothetical protein
LTKLFIGETEIILCIDETGDQKKGQTLSWILAISAVLFKNAS